MPNPPQGEVLFVTSSYPRWRGDSTAPFIHHLAQDLRSLGWNVRVLAPHAPGAARDEILDGVPVHRFRYLWPASLETVCYDGGALVKLRANRWLLLRVPFLVVAQWLAVICQLLRHRVALVHAHWLLPAGPDCRPCDGDVRMPTPGHRARQRRVCVAGRCLARLQARRDPACGRGHGQQPGDPRQPSPLAPRTARSNASRWERSVADRPIEDATAHCARMSAKRGTASLAFVGRLVAGEGSRSDLVRAVALLRSEFPAVVALIIGDGPQRAALEAEAREVGVADRSASSAWLSPEDVQRRLRDARIFVGALTAR